jgi:ribosomal protein S18 acetylase RimI-like enzyme
VATPEPVPGRRRGRPSVEIVPLTPALAPAAVAALSEALADDPAWLAMAPGRPAARRRLVARFHRIAVGEALRWGGPHWCARIDGDVIGAAVAFGDGSRYPVPWSAVREAPPFVLAGPATVARAIQVDTRMKRLHPTIPHLYVWFLGVRPAHQRGGVGRALLAEVFAEGDRRGVPVCLDTTKEANVAYYRSAGFAVTGEHPLPRGARIWPMCRPLGAGA